MNLPALARTAALSLAVAVAAGGCVSLDLGAKDLIGETVAAGKALYRTVRLRANGKEERRYTHVTPVVAGQGDVEAAVGCLSYLRGLADAVTESTAEIRDEDTEIVENADGGRSLRCSLTAIVPRA